jgi:hypothetical protein
MAARPWGHVGKQVALTMMPTIFLAGISILSQILEIYSIMGRRIEA